MSTITANNSKTLEQSAKKVENAVKDTSRTLREVALDTGNTVRDFISERTEDATELKRHAEERIVNNPMQSVAIAALGGLVLGALFARR